MKKYLSAAMAILLLLGITPSVNAIDAQANSSIPAGAGTASLGTWLEGWYFESDPDADGWICIDLDEDGYCWEWAFDSGPRTYQGLGVLVSASYHYYSGALTPDNWLISPAISVPSGGTTTITLYAAAQEENFSNEVFAAYVGSSDAVETMVAISSDITATYEFAQYSFDLSDFAGQTIHFAVRHYNSTDNYYLNVDAVELWHEEDEPVFPIGDVNGDGVVTTSDALILLRYALDLSEATPEILSRGDLNGDGEVTTMDAVLVLRYALSLID